MVTAASTGAVLDLLAITTAAAAAAARAPPTTATPATDPTTAPTMVPVLSPPPPPAATTTGEGVPELETELEELCEAEFELELVGGVEREAEDV